MKTKILLLLLLTISSLHGFAKLTPKQTCALGLALLAAKLIDNKFVTRQLFILNSEYSNWKNNWRGPTLEPTTIKLRRDLQVILLQAVVGFGTFTGSIKLLNKYFPN